MQKKDIMITFTDYINTFLFISSSTICI